MRRPLAKWAPADPPGPHEGIQPENVLPEILNLIARPDGGVDSQMFISLQTDLSIDDMQDLLEVRDVHASWNAAAMLNAKERERDA